MPITCRLLRRILPILLSAHHLRLRDGRAAAAVYIAASHAAAPVIRAAAAKAIAINEVHVSERSLGHAFAIDLRGLFESAELK